MLFRMKLMQLQLQFGSLPYVSCKRWPCAFARYLLLFSPGVAVSVRSLRDIILLFCRVSFKFMDLCGQRSFVALLFLAILGSWDTESIFAQHAFVLFSF